MSVLVEELEWTLFNEREIQERLVLCIGDLDIYRKSTVQVWQKDTQGAVKVTGNLLLDQPLHDVLLYIHNAELLVTQNNACFKKIFHIKGNVIFEDILSRDALHILGSNFLFKGKVTIEPSNPIKKNELGFVIDLQSSQGQSSCLFKVAPEADLSVESILRINVEGNCDIAIEGVIRAKAVEIISKESKDNSNIFLIGSGKIKAKIIKISGLNLINYDDSDLSNYDLTNLKLFKNHGKAILPVNGTFVHGFFNSFTGKVLLQQNSNLLVEKYFVNLGEIEIKNDSLILNSALYHKSLIDKARTHNLAELATGGVFYNKGKIFTHNSNFLIKILGFQMVINGAKGYINARMNINTTSVGLSKHIVLNAGGRMFVQEDSVTTTGSILNYPVGSEIYDDAGYMIFTGSVTLSVDNWIYNYEGYFGTKKGVITFLKPVKKIYCHAAEKTCVFEGKIIGEIGTTELRDLSGYTKKIGNEVLEWSNPEEITPLTINPSDSDLSTRIKKLAKRKVIPLHHMFNEQLIKILDEFDKEEVEVDDQYQNEHSTKEQNFMACLNQFRYIATNDFESRIPGLGEQLCSMGFKTDHVKTLICNGDMLESLFSKYELEIFKTSLDGWFSSNTEKMNVLLSNAITERDRLSLQLLIPLKTDIQIKLPFIWSVEVKNSQGINIIVPYLYLPRSLEKTSSEASLIFYDGSRARIDLVYVSAGSEMIVQGRNEIPMLDLPSDHDGSNQKHLPNFRNDPSVTTGKMTVAEGGSLISENAYVVIQRELINKGVVELKNSGVSVEGDFINIGVIESVGMALLDAGKFVHLGRIIGNDLGIKAKNLLIRVMVNSLLDSYTKQIMPIQEQVSDLRVIDKASAKTVVQSTIDIDGELIIDIENFVKFEATKISAEKVYIRCRGKVFVIPIGMYERISWRWSSGSYEKEELDFLVNEFKANEIVIASEEGTVIYSTKFFGNTNLFSNDKILIDVVSKIQTIKSEETSTKKNWWGRKKVRTRSEFHKIVEPIFNRFEGTTKINGEKGVRLVGWRDNGLYTMIMSGTENNPADVELFPAVSIKVHDIQTRSKTTFLGFRVGKSRGVDKTFSQQTIMNVVKTEKGFYGQSAGRWFQVATLIEGEEIYISAQEDVSLLSAIDVYSLYRKIEKAGFAVWFDSGVQGVSIGVGLKVEGSDYKNVETKAIPNILIAKNLISIKSNATINSSGTIFNSKELVFDAKKVNFGVAREKHYISASSFSALIGVNIGVSFSFAGTIGAMKNLQAQNTDGTIGKINTAFAVVKAYSTVSDLIRAVASGNIGASVGAWVSFSIEQSSYTSESSTIIPTIINVETMTCTANEISMKAAQIFAIDAYIKARKLNIDPEEVTFKRSFNSESFGSSFNLAMSSLLGSETANAISNTLDKIRVGRIPVGNYLASFVLKEGSGEKVRQFNTHIRVSGHLTIEVETEATIRGADIVARSLFASFDSLVLESVRDVIKNKEWGASFGITGNVDDPSTSYGKLSNLAANYRKEEGLIISQITRLIGTEQATVIVARTLQLVGAMIANAEIDENGSYTDKGQLTLEVGELFYKYLHSHDNGKILGIGLNILEGELSKIDTGNAKFNFEPEVGYKNREGNVLATIGLGDITIGKQHGDILNRDLNVANPLNGISQMKSIKAFIPSSLPSFEEFSLNFKEASKHLGQDLAEIGEIIDNWFSIKTNKEDNSDQDTTVETDDENSPRKSFKKFTKVHTHTDNDIDLAAEYERLPTENQREVQENVQTVQELQKEKGILEGKLKIVADKAGDYLNKYNKYADSNPILAKTYLISGLILAKGLVGAAVGGISTAGAGIIPGFVGGFVKGVGDEVRGAIINYAVGDNIASFVNEGIEKYSPMIIKLDSSLSPQDAAILASLALATMLSGKEFMSFAKAMKGVNFASVKMTNGKLTGVSEKSFTDTTSKIKITEQTTKKFPNTKIKAPTKYPAHAEKIDKNSLKLSKTEITNAAKKLGFKPDKDPPFNSHGQPAFKKGNRYITPDVDSHKGGIWKMFDNKGNRIGTYDKKLNIIGK